MSIMHQEKPSKPVFVADDTIDEMLQEMVANTELNTEPILVKDSDSVGKMMSFKERHMTYLRNHPKIDREGYLANLKTMIKIRNQ